MDEDWTKWRPYGGQGSAWQAIVRRKGHPSKSKAFPKKILAERWAAKVETELSEALHVGSLASVTPVKDLLTKYRDEISIRKKGHTVEQYRIATLIEHFGGIILSRLTAQMVVDYVDERLEEVTSDSVRKELNLFSHAIDTGMALWHVQMPANPVTTARNILRVTHTLKPGNKRDRRPTQEELTILYGSHIGSIVEFAVETAMRRGEILNMRPEHRNGNELHIPITKTGQPRTIPLSRRACKILDEKPAWDIEPHSLSQAFRRVCEANKIHDLRFHDMRHEGAAYSARS